MRHCWGTMTMPHTRSGHDQDRSRNMRTRDRRLGPLVQHPPPPPPGRHHTTTNRKSTHNNTKGSGLNKPPQDPGLDTPAKGHCTRYVALHPLRGDTPVTWRCTRYVALHPLRRAAPVTWRCTRTEGVQCLQIGCNAYTSGARPPVTSSDADLPEWRSTEPTGLAATGSDAPPTTNSARQRHTPRRPPGPGGNEPPTINRPGSNAPPTTNRARGRQGQTGLRDDEPSGRLAALARHKAWARRSRGIKPGRVAPAA